MNRRISVSVALAITIIAITVTFAITWIISMNTFDATVSAVTRLQSQYQKLAEIDSYVRGNYYGEINEEQLFDRVATGYMAGLGDRYSVYYSEKDYTEMTAMDNGTLVNIGVEVMREADGSYRIVRVYAGSPAERAGVQPFSAITAIGENDIKSYTSLSAVRNALQVYEGEELSLRCQLDIASEETYTVRYLNYQNPTVESQMVGGYAYIRISSFTASTFTDFDYEVRQAINGGALGIVFDVRGNNTGRFSYSYDMIDILCPRGTVAKAEYKNNTTRVLATSDESFVDLPMAVLVDGGTGGAAELFAVSVRDLAGGQIVGTRTAGKGTIQGTPQRLADGAAVVVTTAKLLTSTEESFDGTGLAPNVEVEMPEGNELLLYTPQPDKDIQILRSIEVLRSMVREAGGDPDAGPADSSGATPAGEDSPSPADSSLADSSLADSSLGEGQSDESGEASSSSEGE